MPTRRASSLPAAEEVLTSTTKEPSRTCARCHNTCHSGGWRVEGTVTNTFIGKMMNEARRLTVQSKKQLEIENAKGKKRADSSPETVELCLSLVSPLFLLLLCHSSPPLLLQHCGESAVVWFGGGGTAVSACLRERASVWSGGAVGGMLRGGVAGMWA